MTDEHDLFGNELPSERTYDTGNGKTVGRKSLGKTDQETQIAAMRNWFFANYEDPAENTPYIGSEGGYQFIHGGPFNPRDELENEFSGIVSDEVVGEVVHSIERFSDEWAPRIEFAYEDYLVDSILQFTEHYHAFAETVSHTRLLAVENVPFPQQQHLYRLLYVSAIIAFETYVSDNFISSVFKYKARLRQFVETDLHFCKGSIHKRDVFKAAESIEGEAKKYLLDFGWHRLIDVSRMFTNTLSVKFPTDISFLKEAIGIRHDIVHRGGKKKDNTYHQITKEDIEKVISAVSAVVWAIERQMNPEAVKLTEDDGNDGLTSF
jgi:hypothetical protein